MKHQQPTPNAKPTGHIPIETLAMVNLEKDLEIVSLRRQVAALTSEVERLKGMVAMPGKDAK